MLIRCNRYGRKLLPVGIYSTAQRRIVSNKPFAKKYGGASGIGIMVVGASYAVLGGAVLVFLGSVSYTLWKSKQQSSITPSSDTSEDGTKLKAITRNHNGTEVIQPASSVKEN